MSLETVVEDIQDEARERANEIRAEAEEDAEAILEAAEDDATEIRENRWAAAEREIEQEREQRLSSAKLEAKQEQLSARQEVLADVHERVEAAVADIEGDRREELTRALLAAAAEEFDDDGVAVYGRADDEGLIETILADYDGYEYAGAYDCLGGIVVESESSRIRVNNTFDSVLEDVWEDELRSISDRLFEER